MVAPLRVRAGGASWRFFSTLATFGTAVDITVAEMAIESFFPADEATERTLREQGRLTGDRSRKIRGWTVRAVSRYRGLDATVQRAPSGLLVRRGGDRILFDCGEGTQRQLLRSVGLPDIEHVFLTHFHADHVLGLPGMMKTFALRGSAVPLRIYGPRGLRGLKTDLRRIDGRLTYEVQPGGADRRRRGGAGRVPRRRHATAHGTEHSATHWWRTTGRAFDPDRARDSACRRAPARPAPARRRREADGAWSSRQGAGGAPPGPQDRRVRRHAALRGDRAGRGRGAAGARGDLPRTRRPSAPVQTGHSTARAAAARAAEAGVTLLALTHLSPRYFAPASRRRRARCSSGPWSRATST